MQTSPVARDGRHLSPGQQDAASQQGKGRQRGREVKPVTCAAGFAWSTVSRCHPLPGTGTQVVSGGMLLPSVSCRNQRERLNVCGGLCELALACLLVMSGSRATLPQTRAISCHFPKLGFQDTEPGSTRALPAVTPPCSMAPRQLLSPALRALLPRREGTAVPELQRAAAWTPRGALASPCTPGLTASSSAFTHGPVHVWSISTWVSFHTLLKNLPDSKENLLAMETLLGRQTLCIQLCLSLFSPKDKVVMQMGQ